MTLMPPHLTVEELRTMFGKRHWAKLYTFALVRNPWDRQLSFYGYMRNADIIPRQMPFLDYLKAMEQRDERWFAYKPHYLPAAAFITDRHGIAVNQVIKYEDRRRGLEIVRDRIGLQALGERHENGFARPQQYADAYCDAGIDIVERCHVEDIRLFDYRFA